MKNPTKEKLIKLRGATFDQYLSCENLISLLAKIDIDACRPK